MAHGRLERRRAFVEPFAPVGGTSFAFSYQGRTLEPHESWILPSAVLGVVTLERVLGLQALGLVALCGAPWAPADALPPGIFEGLVAVAIGCAFGPFLLLHPVAARVLRRMTSR